MNIVKLVAQYWQTSDDFYRALLRKLGAPDWHGKSITALIDSMIVGDINEVGSPMRVVVTGLDRASETAFDELISAFAALARYGAVARITSDHASIEIADGASPFLADQPDN